MKCITLPLLALLFAAAFPAGAQSNTSTNKAGQEVEIDSNSAYFDGLTNQMVYIGNVHVTDHVKAWLQCERLTVFVPANGGAPTNIVAETNVVVDVIDSGFTNHIVADRGVFTYGVVTNSVEPLNLRTNEIITFTDFGTNMPELTNPKGIIRTQPLILDVVQRKFLMPGPTRMILRPSPGSATNSSPFNLLNPRP